MLEKFKRVNFSYVVAFCFILWGIFTRFWGIWYSEFQGDEINPLRYLDNIKGTTPHIWDFFNYILDQKRGPGQYVINYLNTSLFGFHGEFQIRLPFFVFSVLSILTVYILAKKIFNKQSAIISAVILSLNGLYIAFGRITQYQSFMYFISPLALLIFIKSFYSKNYKGLFLSGFLFSLCMLGHYDTLSFFPFFATFLIVFLLQNKKEFFYVLKSGFSFLTFFLIPSLIFYIPFFQGTYYEETAKGYLLGRLLGSGFMPRTPYAELGKLLTLYMPAEAWLLFLGTTLLGVMFIFNNAEIKKFLFLKPTFLKIMSTAFVTLLFAVVIFSLFPIKPRSSTFLVYGISFFTILLLSRVKKLKPEVAGIVVWFLTAFAIYFFYIKDPRTHVYITFLPAFLLSGYGIQSFINIKIKFLKPIILFLLTSFGIYLCLFYYVVFINKNPEYPFWNKELFGRTLYEVGRVRYKKVDGVFGFNSYRHWSEIRDMYDRGCFVGGYNSNEKNAITRFYLGFDQTYPDNPDLIFGAETIFIVEGPQSWYFKNINNFTNILEYPEIYTFYNYNNPVVHVLGRSDVYPEKRILCAQ